MQPAVRLPGLRYNRAMVSEFDLIAKYFTHTPRRPFVKLGVGDDCALLLQQPGMQLAVSTDMLVEGRHFFPDADPFALGHKCLAVNLSDLAAMGAKPLAFTLALSLPEARDEWLGPFSEGMLKLADRFECDLIGGDTTKGPLNICITIFGELAANDALRRDGARIGDDVWISGALGDARLALGALTGEINLDTDALHVAEKRLHMPEPRVALGIALRGVANAALDVSDGLVGDLAHILERSAVGARIDADALPFGPMLSFRSTELRRRFALAGGDDYELCFTASAASRNEVLEAAQRADTQVTHIGVIEAVPGLRLVDSEGKSLDLQLSAFDHFAS